MNEGKDRWEKITNITEEYLPDPDLANRTIKDLNKCPKTKQRITYVRWISVAASILVFVIGLSVFLPIYLNSNEIEIIYYSTDKIEFEDIENVDQFVLENNLNVLYYNDMSTITSCARIKEDHDLAYINQDMISIGESGFDQIILNIVVLPNSEFEFINNFKVLDDSLQIFDLTIYYSGISLQDVTTYFATFKYEGLNYYLKVITADSTPATSKIEQYVNLLFN